MPRRRGGTPINGWLVLDKPAGLTSARALARVLGITGAAKGGHGGTLDPLATGVLPIALGEATKTVSRIMDGAKLYRFTVRWGEARDTDDAAGAVVATSDVRPDVASIQAVLAGLGQDIDQTPPAYAAVKLAGERAYAMARRGETPDLQPRRVRLDGVTLLATPDADHAAFELACGKGFYIRSFARDLAQALGTVGHVSELRRLRSGPFSENAAISLERLGELVHSPAFAEHLLPVDTALADIPVLPIPDTVLDRFLCGQTVRVLRAVDGPVRVVADGRLVALAEVAAGEVRPVRVFNL